MTWEELMDRIDTFDAAGMVREPSIWALRAIVELHKPDGNSDCAYCNKRFACKKCGSRLESYISYPCPTIEAIEKEIK